MTDQVVALACAVLGWAMLCVFFLIGPYAVLMLGLLLAVPTFLFACFAALAGLLGVIEDWWEGNKSGKDLLGRFLMSTAALAIALAPLMVVYLHARTRAHI